MNSRRLLREESVEHKDLKYNKFAKFKARINKEILEKGTGKQPVLLYSPQPIREYDYTNPLSIQFVKCKNSKIRIIKSSNEMKLPDGIADAKIFQDIVKRFAEDSLAVKKLSLKYLLDQSEEVDKLTQKVRELEEKLKNAPKAESAADTKKNPFAPPAAEKTGNNLTFCSKCRDIVTDEDKNPELVNKSLLDF